MYPGLKFRLCGCVLFSILAGFVFQELEAATPEVTIDPRVWQDVENGGTGHFLILLREQSDTKAAAKGHADRKGKRRAVTENLRDTASRSQTNLLRILQAQNVKHRPYWIINMIAAEGKRGLVEALSKREDVQAI